MMKKFLVRLLKAMLRELIQPHPYEKRTLELVNWANEYHANVNGERKRHQVLNQLVMEFPAVRRRDLALAIEQVLQGGLSGVI